MQYKKKRINKHILKYRAIDKLYEKMMFYDTAAVVMGNKICKLLERSDKSLGIELAGMYKTMGGFNNIVIDCAAKLAPYQTPKLQTVEVNKKIEHRFVIRAPLQSPNTANWLKAIEASPAPPPILQRTKVEKANSTGAASRVLVEDADIVEDDKVEEDHRVYMN